MISGATEKTLKCGTLFHCQKKDLWNHQDHYKGWLLSQTVIKKKRTGQTSNQEAMLTMTESHSFFLEIEKP